MMVAVLLLAVLACGGALAPAEGAPPAPLTTLRVPGGTAALAEAAGLDPRLPRARIMLAVIRALYDVPDRVDAAEDAHRVALRSYLEKLESPDAVGTAPTPEELVPLPLSTVAWETIVSGSGNGPLVARILGKRDAALLYYGFSALDGPTSAWLDSTPGMLRALSFDRRPALVAAFGRSLRVLEGHVQVPGGSAAEPLWIALAGQRPDAPGPFVLRLFDRDQGRLAYFYDTIAHLDQGQQAFALGLHERDAQVRLKRFERLYDAARRALAGFDPLTRPFDRVPDDLAHILLTTRVSLDGTLAPPASAALWRAVFAGSGIPDAPTRELPAGAPGPDLDAAGLMELLGTPDSAIRRDRAETWFFAQRALESIEPVDFPSALVALRGMGPYKALLLTLERMDVRRSEPLALAVRRARWIDDIRDDGRARVELGLFQGSLAILERAHFWRALQIPAIQSLVRSLCSSVAGTGDRSQVAAWVEGTLLPVLEQQVQAGKGGRPDRPMDDLVLAAMAGLARDRPPGVPFDWEGLSYVVDPPAGEFRRLLAIRAKQGGPSLDAALALLRAGEALAAATTPPAIEDARQRLAAAAARAAAEGSGEREGEEPPIGRVIEEAVRQLERLTAPRPTDLSRIARPLLRAADAQLASVLVSLAYAPHLGYPDSPVLLGGDPARHHDFGLDAPRSDVRRYVAWQVPVEVRTREAGWRLNGSVLGLDMTLANLSLRRAFSESFPPPPAYRETERAAFAEAAVLTNPQDADAGTPARVVAAVQAGRQRLASASGDGAALAALGEAAHVDEWRANLVAWMAEHEPDRAGELFSLGELASLGGASAMAPGTLVASGWSLFAELRGVPLTWASWTTLSGRKATSLVPARVPDLTIGMAEALLRLDVPPTLQRGVLLMATQDLLDSLRTNYDDDWMTLISQAQRVASGLVEDYVAGQTLWGALIPAEGAGIR